MFARVHTCIVCACLCVCVCVCGDYHIVNNLVGVYKCVIINGIFWFVYNS